MAVCSGTNVTSLVIFISCKKCCQYIYILHSEKARLVPELLAEQFLCFVLTFHSDE